MTKISGNFVAFQQFSFFPKQTQKSGKIQRLQFKFKNTTTAMQAQTVTICTAIKTR
jgi:hypothetical protein